MHKLRKKNLKDENILLQKPTQIRILLHFVAFFHVASLFSTGVDNKKVGVDNEKALELTNSTVFHRGRQLKSSRAGKQNIFFIFQHTKIHPKMQQNILLHSGMIMPCILV